MIQYPNAANNGTVWDVPYEIGGNSGDQDLYALVWYDLTPYVDLLPNITSIISDDMAI